jgi:diaminopimelate epimerase
MSIPFRKYEALGNDYFVIDPRDCPAPPNAHAVRLLCDRHYGIGSDGILYGPIPDNRSDTAGFRLRIFNPDGSEAEKSGNGIRIFARYLRDSGRVAGSEGIIVTAGGNVQFRYLDRGARRIEVDMGIVTFQRIDEPLRIGTEDLRVTALSIGNPHCVVRFPGATAADAQRLGPQIETHPWFPNRTNVQLLDVIDRDRIRIQIWERGAGYTFASGSSSCASASAAHRLGLVGEHVFVEMPGGVIEIDLDREGRVRMTGDVRATFSGTISEDLAGRLERPSG